MDLNQKEEVEVHVVIGDNIPEVQFHYEIRQESTGLHKIVSHQTGQEVCAFNINYIYLFFIMNRLQKSKVLVENCENPK